MENQKKERVYGRWLELTKLARIKRKDGTAEFLVAEAMDWKKNHYVLLKEDTIKALVDYLVSGGESPAFDVLPGQGRNEGKKVLFVARFRPAGTNAVAVEAGAAPAGPEATYDDA
jgi:hypothetical protein